MNDTPNPTSHRPAILLIMAAVLLWGMFHAVGVYLYNPQPLKAVIVIGCELAFLGFWGLMLAARRARLRRER